MREAEVKIGCRDLFAIFFKAGLAFGGGLGILAVLEDEFVTRRKALTKEEFLAMYGIGRIVPSGTMSALAVGLGQRFCGFAGTLVALVAMVLPALILTLLLTVVYQSLRGSEIFHAVEAAVLPAALAFILVAAFRLGKDTLRPSMELLLALGAFAGVFFKLNPALLLIGGGILGAVILGFGERGEKTE